MKTNRKTDNHKAKTQDFTPEFTYYILTHDSIYAIIIKRTDKGNGDMYRIEFCISSIAIIHMSYFISSRKKHRGHLNAKLIRLEVSEMNIYL